MGHVAARQQILRAAGDVVTTTDGADATDHPDPADLAQRRWAPEGLRPIA